MFAKLRLSILSARLLARRCRPRLRSLPSLNRPHPAALIWQQARPRPVLLLPHPSRPQRKCSPPPLLFLLLLLASGAMPILAVVRLLQSSSEIFCGVFAKFLFEHGWIGKFSSIGTRQRGLEGLMSPERIEEREKARLIGGDEKADQSLRFIVKRRHSICRRKSYCRKRRQRDQVLQGDGFRVRLGNVTTRALITGVGGFGNILGESFIQPAWDAVGVKPVDDEVHDLVPEQVAGKFVFWVALNEEASLRLNSAGPGFQFAEGLKLLPLFRTFENINVRFDVAWRLFALQLFGDDAVMKLRLYRNGRGDLAVNEMVNEMVGLAVLPLLRVNGERFLPEWVRIALTEPGEFHFGQ